MAHSPFAAALAALMLASCSSPSQPASEGEPVSATTQAVEACPPGNTVLGIDISAYQHPNGAAIDWGQVAASRRFVIIKASEGTGYTNDYYADDAAQARAHGMIVGAYHFLLFNHDGTEQANQFLASVGGNIASGDLPAMLDVEDVNHSATPGQRVAIMQAFLDRVEQVTGRKPMIYSGSWYWGPYMGNPGGYAGVYPMVWAAYVPAQK